MSELSGTLEGVGLPAIVRFLTGLKKTGCLQVQHEGWHGEVFFASGEVRNAVLGSHRGLQALDALIQNQSGASFTFEADVTAPGQPDIELQTDALLAHLESGSTISAPRLPSLDGIPSLVEQADTTEGEEPLPLDRGTLQTLLAIDGARSVREIMSQRGSFDALWQIANLVDIGLVRVIDAAHAPTLVGPAPARVPDAAHAPTIIAPAPTVQGTATPVSNVRPIGVDLAPTPTEAESARCPKLGFEDDPSTSFGRPTRLHRCYAAGSPLPLSLDQQRELCISEQFGTCPRLAMAAGSRAENRVHEPEDPRIVRLPVGGRNVVADRQAVGAGESARTRSNPVQPNSPTPLRARQERNAVGVADTVGAPPREPITPEVRPARASITLGEPDRRLAIPIPVLVAGVAVIVVIAALGLLLAPRVADLFNEESPDAEIASLPNTSAIAAGTPITQLTPRPTTIAGRPNSASTVTGSSPSGASAASAPAQPTLPPEPTVAPTAAPTEAPTAVVAGVTVMDERFADNARKWPSSPQGTAVLTSGSYRLIPRTAGQFVAVDVPGITPLQDVVVSATFHKVSGPAGGGYGIILRDQAATPQIGTSQNGSYYVLEIGDKGEVGIWRRDNDHWVDLLPWQKSDAVKTGTGTNDLTVRAIGNRLSLAVNGVEIASRNDATLPSGLVGVFAGGDGNVVSVDRLTVQTP